MEKSGRSGHYLKFVNRLAREVRAKYPEAILETLAYWDYIEPTLDDTVPEANVIIRFAHLLVDIAHDISYHTNQEKLELMGKWAALCRRRGAPFYMWEYLISLFPNFPMPVMYQFPVNYRTFYEMGVSGCFAENEIFVIPDFWSCNQWMLSKYLEDPYADFNALLEDFVTKYYGKAADAVRKYLDLAHELVQESDMYVILDQTCSNWNYITPEFAKAGCDLFEEAFSAVRGDCLLEQRVREAFMALYRTIAVRQDDLLRMMKLRGLNFTLPDTAAAAGMTLKALEQLEERFSYHIGKMSAHHDLNFVKRIRSEQRILRRLDKRKGSFSIPEILCQTVKENIYNIPAYEIIRFFETQNAVTEIEDAASDSGIVLRYKAASLGFTDELIDPAAWRLPIILATTGKEKRRIEITKADLDGGAYKWFYLPDICDVTHDSNSTLYVFESRGLAIRLNPIRECFPFESCDIYVSLRGEGHSFGGAADAADAICFDRFLIVRRA